jgi:hypothetical protein
MDSLPVSQEAIDLMFNQLDCRHSTYRSHTGFVFAVAWSDFPAPTGIVNQLNDGIFYASIFHKISSQDNFAEAKGGPRSRATYTANDCPYVHLYT